MWDRSIKHMDCRAVSSSSMATIMAMTLLMVFAYVCEANMVFELKNKFENLSHEEMMIARWKHDQRIMGRSLSAIDINVGAELYPGISLFFAQVVLGDPPKAFYPQITPSLGMSWFYCNGCKRCPSESSFKFDINKYEVNDSSKGKILGCDHKMCGVLDKNRNKKMCSDNICKYEVHYDGGGTTVGKMVEDTLRLNTVIGDDQTSPVSADFVFGCGTDQFDGLESSDWAFDGFMGVSMSNLSMLSQLITSKHVKKNTWSHCFKGGSKGGTMAFGEVSIQKTLKMTPLLSNIENYEATMVNFSIGQKLIPINTEQKVLFDVSNSYNYFPNTSYKAFFAEIHSTFTDFKFTSPNPFSCFLYSGRIDKTFPILTYTFEGGVEMKLHPKHYIFERNADEWCISVLSGESNGDYKDHFLITEFALEGRMVVYDVENKQIGWADYDCDAGIKILDDKTGNEMVVSPHHIRHDKFSGAIKVGWGAMLFISSLIFTYLTL